MYSLFVGLAFFLLASWVPGGEQENIHLLTRSVINSEQARPSLSPPVSVSFSLSIRRARSRSLSLPVSPTFSHYLSLCVGLSLCVFQPHPASANVSLPPFSLSLSEFPSNTLSSFCFSKTTAIPSVLIMKALFTPENDVHPALTH